MIINNKEYNIDELLNDVKFDLKTDSVLGLTKNQISILQKNSINYEVPSLKELIFLVNNALDNSEDEELEFLLEELSERDYYEGKK